MIITCRGQRISARVVAELMDALEVWPLANGLREDGYTLQPVRAPRGLDRGRLLVRLTWTKVVEDVTYTVRTTITLHQPKIV